MSGFEGLAAIIGVADFTLRSVFEVYDFISTLKSVPKDLERLRREIKLFLRCIRPLDKRLAITDDEEDKVSVQKSGLREAVETCNKACADLQLDLNRWSPAAKTSVRARFTVRFNKKKIETATAEIVAANQAVLLAAVAINLSLQYEIEEAMSAQKSSQTCTQTCTGTGPTGQRLGSNEPEPKPVRKAPPSDEESHSVDRTGEAGNATSAAASSTTKNPTEAVQRWEGLQFTNEEGVKVGRTAESLPAGGQQHYLNVSSKNGKGGQYGIF